MGRLKRKLKITVGALFALLLFVYAALYFLIGSEYVRARVEAEISARTGYEIKIGALRLAPPLGLALSDVAVAKDGAVLFRGKKIAGSVTLRGLYDRRIHRLSLEKPSIHLSLQDLFRPSAKPAPQFSIGELTIDDGEVVLETGQRAPFALSAISLSATNVNLGAETGLQLKANLPALDASAIVTLSGAAAAKRAEIAVYQAKEKKVFAAALLMTAKAGNAYEITASGEAADLRWGTETIDGGFQAVVAAGAKFETVQWTMEAKMPRLPMKLLPMGTALEPGAVAATLSGGYSAAEKTATLEKIAVRSNLGAIDGRAAVRLAEKPAQVTGTLRLSGLALDRLKPLMPVALGALKYGGVVAAEANVTGAYNDPVVSGSAWNDGAKVEGEKISARRLAFRIPFAWHRSSLRATAGSLQLDGLAFGRQGETQFKFERASFSGDGVKESGKPVAIDGGFQIIAGRFSTPDESKIGENLNAKGRFTCSACGAETSFRGEAQIESLELLWNKFFGDFKERKPKIQIDGRYRRAADEMTLNRLAVALDSIGRLDVKGSVARLLSDPAFALEVQSDDLRAAGFYDFFIRDTFKTAHPIVGQIGVGGKTALAFRAKGSRASFALEGKLRLEQILIQEKSGGWRAGPIALDLPFSLSYPAAAKETTGAPAVGPSTAPALSQVEGLRTGNLSIDEIKGVSVVVPKISAPVALWNNSLRFPEPVRFSIFGGAGAIEGLAWRDAVAAPWDFSLSLTLKDLRLTELTAALGWHRFDGTLSGSIPQVRWAGDSLTSDGTMTLNLFGGSAEIRGMAIEKPLSPVRSIRMSARLDALDLEQASHTFEFGRISGALSGTIDNLVISQGQPAEFSAEIHTVDKSGVGQWISVDALNKITVVSSGNDAGSLYGGLAGFFDFFRYSKLGFKAALKNDRLTLRGIESKGGQEYLVVGSWIPPTVNIVSYTQEISFSELMKRLDRVKNRSGGK